jgi:hypothetical protein
VELFLVVFKGTRNFTLFRDVTFSLRKRFCNHPLRQLQIYQLSGLSITKQNKGVKGECHEDVLGEWRYRSIHS